MTTEARAQEPNAPRRRLASHLSGHGIEVGPGRYPFRLLPPGTQVRFVDRLAPDERRLLLTELAYDPERPVHGPSAVDVEPDVVADLDVDRLGAIADGSEDFVIASHVLEHLADPIGFLDDIHRVLRPGGLAMLLLPDRRRTEDRFRPATPLDHVVADYRAGTTQVSDEHIIEYVRDRGRRLPRTGRRRHEVLEQYRRHSIHVHCWDASEFAELVAWSIEHLGHLWELVDTNLYEPPIHYEFGLLLRRSHDAADASSRSERFRHTWQARWAARMVQQPTLHDELRDLPALERWLAHKARATVRRIGAAGLLRTTRTRIRMRAKRLR